MTHKQQAIEALNRLTLKLAAVPLEHDEFLVLMEIVGSLRTAVTLMEPVENPAKLPATMPRVPLPRGPISLDAEEEPVLECSRCYGDGFECKAVDVDGHPECPSCGDRNNLRVRR